MRNVLGEPDPVLMTDAERRAFLTPEPRIMTLSHGEPRDLIVTGLDEFPEWRRLRLAMGYSYAAIASLVGTTTDYYHKIEIGEVRSLEPRLGISLRNLFATIAREVGHEG